LVKLRSRPSRGARHPQLGFLVGLEIANADERPAWKAGDFFERTFGRRAAAKATTSSGVATRGEVVAGH
jgi:hypothetical protein